MSGRIDGDIRGDLCVGAYLHLRYIKHQEIVVGKEILSDLNVVPVITVNYPAP